MSMAGLWPADSVRLRVFTNLRPKVNEAYERLLKSDVKYRFSIDMASLKAH